MKKCAKKGTAKENLEVQRSLLNLALGYTMKLKKIYKLKNTYYDERGKKVEEERLEEREEEQYFPPNLSAQTFWLKNRLPEAWDEAGREREDAENGGIIILPEAECGAESEQAVKNE